MRKSLLLLLILISCTNSIKFKKKESLSFKQQWINPIFLYDDFEKELNFPLWFNDSIIIKNKIFHITRRIYNENYKDSNGYFILPKEKFIYTFNKNGKIKKIDYYSYFDSKEILAFSFIYTDKNTKKYFRQLQVLPLKAEYKQYKDLFKIQLNTDATHHFTFYKLIEKNKKKTVYQDLEHKNKLLIQKNKKYFGALSIDSILHPNQDDWIILGSINKPYKRFQSQNIVNQKNIYTYTYSKNGLLLQRKLEKYPFINKKKYYYNNHSQWNFSIDSLFYENTYISSEYISIEYDKYNRPRKIYHTKSNSNKIKSMETFSYSLIK